MRSYYSNPYSSSTHQRIQPASPLVRFTMPHHSQGPYACFTELSSLKVVALRSKSACQSILRESHQIPTSFWNDSEHLAEGRFSCVWLLSIKIEAAILI